jgi:hypothetical protein
MRGREYTGEHAANYIAIYSDGTEDTTSIRRQFQIGHFNPMLFNKCYESVYHYKNRPVQKGRGLDQTLVDVRIKESWINWLWAWENRYPEKALVGFRFEPVSGLIIISAMTASNVDMVPTRWLSRGKACLSLLSEEAFLPDLDDHGLLEQIQLDMGQVISATKRPIYPDDTWEETYNNRIPGESQNQVLVEYTAHPDACFHLSDGQTIPVSQVENEELISPLSKVTPSTQRVVLKVVENGRPTPVKLHVHGKHGEYLSPVDRHRVLDPTMIEDHSVDFAHGTHSCTYISGETAINLPLGPVYIEVSKGFERKPVRRRVEVAADTQEIQVEIEKVLPWREKGWVTADTHVHFLSPHSALMESAG